MTSIPLSLEGSIPASRMSSPNTLRRYTLTTQSTSHFLCKVSSMQHVTTSPPSIFTNGPGHQKGRPTTSTAAIQSVITTPQTPSSSGPTVLLTPPSDDVLPHQTQTLILFQARTQIPKATQVLTAAHQSTRLRVSASKRHVL